ncbi:MAG: DUF3365 domain-containing protein [Verrucomicrobiae bacterium]|nr:DUF3365 domain-containing protein [Verrucomicrobiae bacterium]
MNLLLKINLILLTVFILGLLPSGYISYELLQKNAREQVLQNARLMMEASLAMRGYTSKQIKPLLEAQLEQEFLPQTVPSYSAVEIFNYLRENYPEYTYKEATLNPTNLRDLAKDWEADVVNEFRNHTDKKEIVGHREGPSGEYLYLAKPLKIANESCLTCHSTPEAAPAKMIEKYGSNNGFGWQMHEIVGAQIVSVPMSLPIQKANQAFKILFGSLLVVFIVTLIVLNILLHFIVIRPIKQLSAIADQISTGNMDVEELQVRGRDEVSMLSASFNRMMISLKKAIKLLEDQE